MPGWAAAAQELALIAAGVGLVLRGDLRAAVHGCAPGQQIAQALAGRHAAARVRQVLPSWTPQPTSFGPGLPATTGEVSALNTDLSQR
ncbi:hypothetical protein A5640_03345 [Mycobacterium asiaticum]|uniref:Uncharacterized protein n=1 Tax=Mycobacterium asiaticum TaxID=1790 RepID=A0A1A3KV45_MYCAS|nr:hypothetical protein A5640_03345 [Mycobacterium asiaticum]